MHRLKSYNHLVDHNKQHHRKVLLSNFDLNSHTWCMINYLFTHSKLMNALNDPKRVSRKQKIPIQRFAHNYVSFLY